MEALAKKLMGLSHPLQLVGQTWRVDSTRWDWPEPPRVERRWYAVVPADDEQSRDFRKRTVREALERIGLRTAEASHDYLSEPTALVEPDCINDGRGYRASLVLRRWPREVAPGWLGQALAAPDLAADIGIHIEPQDPQRFARFLRKQSTWQSEANAKRPDAANELGQADAESVRKALIARTDRPCKVAIAVTVRAPDRDQIKRTLATTKHELGLALADMREATFEQDVALEATSLSGHMDLLGAWRTLDCHSVASTWMFQPGTVCHDNGADLGVSNGMLVRLDPFDPSLESFGGLVLSKVGMGKSYLLKLLASRLPGMEVLIVEQRTPAEYASVAGAYSFNLADIAYEDRASRLRDFVSELWATAKRDPRPRLLILDELWSLLRDPALASLIEEIARIGRHHYLSMWIATQQVKEMLDSDGGQAVLNNAAIRVYLKQHDHDLDRLCEAVGLSSPARRFLRSAARGQCLLTVGDMTIPVDIQASPAEHRLITTDPRERVAAA